MDTENRPKGRWRSSVMLGVLAAGVFMANGREIGTYDTEPTTLLTVALVRGDGFRLDRFARSLPRNNGRFPDFVTVKNGHLVSRYPVATALLAAPLAWPQLVVIDRVRPGWERDPNLALVVASFVAKQAAALIAALVVVLFHRVLIRLGLGSVALPTVAAVAFGSDLWTVASQALWQHGPAALAVVVLVWLLLPEAPSKRRFALAGLISGALVAFRAIDVVFALAIFGFVATSHRRSLLWFLPGAILIGLALSAYNLSVFGTILGGQGELESLHPRIHGVAGPWSGNLVAGAAGTFFSPSRGLFVYSPWAALAIVLAPLSMRGKALPRVLRWVLCAVVPYGILLSKYSVWWGGFCYGPRYWTEVVPLFGILLAYAIDWARTRSRRVAALFGIAILWSISLQIVGALLYPSSWNLSPRNVDTNHERLWDWKDTEVSRCLREWWARMYS